MQDLNSSIAGIKREMLDSIRGHIRSLRTRLVKDGADIGPEDLLQKSNEDWATMTGALNQLLNRSENMEEFLSIRRVVMLLKNSDFHSLVSKAAGLKQTYGEAQAAVWLKEIMDTELAR